MGGGGERRGGRGGRQQQQGDPFWSDYQAKDGYNHCEGTAVHDNFEAMRIMCGAAMGTGAYVKKKKKGCDTPNKVVTSLSPRSSRPPRLLV